MAPRDGCTALAVDSTEPAVLDAHPAAADRREHPGRFDIEVRPNKSHLSITVRPAFLAEGVLPPEGRHAMDAADRATYAASVEWSVSVLSRLTVKALSRFSASSGCRPDDPAVCVHVPATVTRAGEYCCQVWGPGDATESVENSDPYFVSMELAVPARFAEQWQQFLATELPRAMAAVSR